ncbi:MAG: ATP-binding protein [Firmicutes bacterium]|nr:ATP-binding protein [Bacillota bacterium]
MIYKSDKNEIIDILQDWNLWKREQSSGIPREKYLARLKSFIDTNQVITITGPRRSGKSFIMKQMAKALIEKSKVKAENVLIVNLEDPRFPALSLKLLEQIYEAYLEFLSPKGQIFIFLDEVQEIESWEKWVRMMHELRKAKIIVSGSNAKLLSRELGTLLTGRHLDLTVFPLSFKEFLEFNGVILLDRLDIINRKIEIKGLLRKYLEFGSFPEAVLSEQKKEILLNYFEDIVNKDLLRRFRIRKYQDLNALVKFYLSNISSLATYRSLEKSLKISNDTIEKFSGYLEQVYLVFLLKRFSFKVREQENSPRKVYAIDTGLCNAVGFRFSENFGRLAENLVFLELKRRQALKIEKELYFWKDEYHKEVDFLIKEGLRVKELIQVCWNIRSEKTKSREIRSLLKAMDEFELDEAAIITEDDEAEEKIKGKTIRFLPLWKWLLEDE